MMNSNHKQEMRDVTSLNEYEDNSVITIKMSRIKNKA